MGFGGIGTCRLAQREAPHDLVLLERDFCKRQSERFHLLDFGVALIVNPTRFTDGGVRDENRAGEETFLEELVGVRISEEVGFVLNGGVGALLDGIPV